MCRPFCIRTSSTSFKYFTPFLGPSMLFELLGFKTNVDDH